MTLKIKRELTSRIILAKKSSYRDFNARFALLGGKKTGKLLGNLYKDGIHWQGWTERKGLADLFARVQLGDTPAVIAGTPYMIVGTPTMIAGTPTIPVLLRM